MGMLTWGDRFAPTGRRLSHPPPGNRLALVKAAGYSVNRLTRLRRRSLQLLHRPQYPLPHRAPVQVASLKHGVGGSIPPLGTINSKT